MRIIEAKPSDVINAKKKPVLHGDGVLFFNTSPAIKLNLIVVGDGEIKGQEHFWRDTSAPERVRCILAVGAEVRAYDEDY